ncbi:putative 11-beta-hydroxysteroid dehydrogenase [Helianthus annuus]|nr:putative 11-beta-hydroxysteroid dehydrogenase [Helianthus annuus]
MFIYSFSFLIFKEQDIYSNTSLDMIHAILNVVFPLVSVILFIVLVPAFWLFNLLRFCFKSMYPEQLAGKVILITGASTGIGEQLAIEFAKEGACLALVARREKQLNLVAQYASSIGSPNVIVLPADVSKLEDCKRFVDQTIKHFGRCKYIFMFITLLVNVFEGLIAK